MNCSRTRFAVSVSALFYLFGGTDSGWGQNSNKHDRTALVAAVVLGEQDVQPTEEQLREAQKLHQPIQSVTLERFLKENPGAKAYQPPIAKWATHYSIGDISNNYTVFLFWKNQPFMYRKVEIRSKDDAQKLQRDLTKRLGEPIGTGLSINSQHKKKHLFAHEWSFRSSNTHPVPGMSIGCLAEPLSDGRFRVTITVIDKKREVQFGSEALEKSEPKR
jgi:hypothetical protein